MMGFFRTGCREIQRYQLGELSYCIWYFAIKSTVREVEMDEVGELFKPNGREL
jgi:hypothetical protein